MSTLEELVSAVMEGEDDTAVSSARDLVDNGVGAQDIIDALTAGMREVGDKFARMEIFLPEMVMAAQSMKAVMKEIDAELAKETSDVKAGVIVIGTVKGDIHEIGKDIVVRLLQVQGFDIHDLGVNVPSEQFVEKAEEVGADIIGISALMTTTMPHQKAIVADLEKKGLRDKYHVILGGAPVSQDWVTKAGADSWGENAPVSIQLLNDYMNEQRQSA